MMVKQGGYSYNVGSPKKGMLTSFKCRICGRIYKQEWSKKKHEKLCAEHNHKDILEEQDGVD